MSLPPLPLIDGHLLIDNSGWVEGLNTCSRYLQYKNLNRRVSVGEKASLNFGSAIHLGLEYRYRSYRNQPVDELFYEDMVKQLVPFYEQHPPPATDWRTLNWCMTTLRKYNEKYEFEDFNLLRDQEGKAMVELSFILHLYDHGAGRLVQPIPVYFTGKIDLPISIDGNIYVMDHKTTSSIGDQHWDKMRLSSQPRGYAWAFEQLTGQKVTGYIINTLRSKEPPLYVQANQPSTRGKTQTPSQWWNESFQRERFYLHDGELDYWKENTISLMERFFWEYNRGYLPMETDWCASYGKCPYYEVCRVAVKDRDSQLNSGLFAPNLWTPLKQTTHENINTGNSQNTITPKDPLDRSAGES